MGMEHVPADLASGDRQDDLDIICPCDYRDPDLVDYDACYCGLYISNEILMVKKNYNQYLRGDHHQMKGRK
jgi:ferredoxin-thioredoxin reductase catalytic subunit